MDEQNYNLKVKIPDQPCLLWKSEEGPSVLKKHNDSKPNWTIRDRLLTWIRILILVLNLGLHLSSLIISYFRYKSYTKILVLSIPHRRWDCNLGITLVWTKQPLNVKLDKVSLILNVNSGNNEIFSKRKLNLMSSFVIAMDTLMLSSTMIILQLTTPES